MVKFQASEVLKYDQVTDDTLVSPYCTSHRYRIPVDHQHASNIANDIHSKVLPTLLGLTNTCILAIKIQSYIT
jgi:hypothetical protein